MKTIVVEGASTAFGNFDMEYGGWAARLHLDALRYNQHAPQHPPIRIDNRAVPGSTVPGIAKQYEVNLARYRPLGKVASIVEIGLNESKIMPGMSKPIIRLELFSKHVGTLCALASEAEVPLIFCRPPASR
jgi:hypothetical protein